MEGRCVGCPDEQNAEIAFLEGGGGGCRKFGLLFFSLGKKCKKGLNQKLKSSPMCFMKPMMLCK